MHEPLPPLSDEHTDSMAARNRRASPGLCTLYPPMPGASNHVGLSLSPQGYLEAPKASWEQCASLSWYGATERALGGCQEQLYVQVFWFESVEKWDLLFREMALCLFHIERTLVFIRRILFL